MPEPLPFDPIAEASRQWDEHWGSEATPSMAAITSIMRAQQILMSRLNEVLAPLDLTFPRYEALMLVYYSRNDELPLGKISDRLQVHRTSVTNVIDKLEAQGYIERVGDSNDRRTILARITAQGRETARRSTELLNRGRFGVAPLDDQVCRDLYSLLEPLRQDAGDFSP